MDSNQQQKIKIWWDEKEKIIREILIGDLNEEDAKRSINEVNKLVASKKKQGFKIINHLVDATKTGIATTKARDVFAAGFKKKLVNKVAIFGGGIIQKTIANFIFNYSGVKNAQYFDSEEEALEWIKEG
ncbi:MAG: hypothetical protein A2Z78_01265 [Candidatus Nealsonbacteria bacterium RBG_13_36_15]|uniref:DUF7793 domain-containing protein n=1 Tax=Candidatus Nealsonbacteria bacterium RBG_13_36_15 TaxID=1801660 RepID=A0A1G2DWF9_9BACT|nr:MAG: hypothetical protein A2Z78_01265 [Candidatus Nealsonbacteria bacterium RBG_13_36_15]